MTHIPCEADLASEDHDKFGEAIMRCTGYSPECAAAGICVFGGCFEPKLITDHEAVEKIAELQAENDKLRSKQAVFEAVIENHIQSLDTRSKSLRSKISESHRWAVHFAKQRFLELQKELKGE